MLTLRKLASLGLLALAGLTGCRQDMHDQPRFKPLARSDFYADLRSARPPVEGTVARGELHDDSYFYSGKIGNNPGDYLPFPISMEKLARGRERFNIYCAPCHSRVGDGNGMIVQRGFRAPPSYHTERLRKAPLGYFFDVITNGFGAMPDYASQISPDDRWCIVAYIRALQLSQSATRADIPAGQAVPSPVPDFRDEPGSGATLPQRSEPVVDKKEEQK
ncbi:MAG: cytochrome c [Acidobacteriales bacterium]|nr:cytochrome c [Terriglobales bacterium]